MGDTLVLRAATEADAAGLAATIAAAFAQYRGKLVPESGAFRETAEAIAAELAKGTGAIVAERNGEALGCVIVQEIEGDLYLGRLSVLKREPDGHFYADALVNNMSVRFMVDTGATGIALTRDCGRTKSDGRHQRMQTKLPRNFISTHEHLSS